LAVTIRRWGLHRALDVRLQRQGNDGTWRDTPHAISLGTRAETDALTSALEEARQALAS